jgi:hypothetical protein
MLRDKWEFEFSAATLAAAAKERKQHHLQRRQWWTEQKKKVMDKVKDSGIQIHDPVAAQYQGFTSNKMSAFEPEIRVRADLQRDLTECHTKIVEHHRKSVEYDGWLQVLMSNKESRFKLTADDYLFFFRKEEPEMEDLQ